MIQWYLVHVQHFILIPGTSPYSIADGDLPLADNKFIVTVLQGETVVGNATYTIKTCKLSGISPLSSKLGNLIFLRGPTSILLGTWRTLCRMDKKIWSRYTIDIYEVVLFIRKIPILIIQLFVVTSTLLCV